MNKLLTALILTATAATAQAKEVVLNCTASSGKTYSMMIDVDAKLGSYGNVPSKLTGKSGNIYVFSYIGNEQFGYMVDRNSLEFNTTYQGKAMAAGKCTMSQTNSKI
jgi:hypothetical protein